MSKNKNSRIVRSGLRMLNRYKLRTFFMMLGIIIGITALTLTLTIGNGVEKHEKGSQHENTRNGHGDGLSSSQLLGTY